MTKLRAIVVDDEPLARDELSFLLGECDDVEVVAEGRDAKSALAACEAQAPDVAFVDLRMPGPDGIALAEALAARHPGMPVVVVSAHDDAALRAFEAEVLDYLLKPVRLDRLKQTVGRIRARVDKSAKGRDDDTGELSRLAVRRRGALVVVDIADIVFFEVKDELVWAVTTDDRFALDLTLAAVQDKVSSTAFFRSHRGALVRVDRIRRMEPSGAGTYELVMDHPDSPRVPLARERARTLKERIPVAG